MDGAPWLPQHLVDLTGCWDPSGSLFKHRFLPHRGGFSRCGSGGQKPMYQKQAPNKCRWFWVKGCSLETPGEKHQLRRLCFCLAEDAQDQLFLGTVALPSGLLDTLHQAQASGIPAAGRRPASSHLPPGAEPGRDRPARVDALASSPMDSTLQFTKCFPRFEAAREGLSGAPGPLSHSSQGASCPSPAEV